MRVVHLLRVCGFGNTDTQLQKKLCEQHTEEWSRNMLKYGLASVRKNPLAKRTTLKTLQHVTTKWLHEARDRDGGHKRCMEAAAARRQPGMNDDNLD